MVNNSAEMTSESRISDSDLSRQQVSDEDNLSFASLDTATARITAEEKFMMQRRAPTYASRGAQDVTANFVAASKQLKPGELVKDEYFTLFEAVGALEVSALIMCGVVVVGVPIDVLPRSWTQKWTADMLSLMIHLSQSIRSMSRSLALLR